MNKIIKVKKTGRTKCRGITIVLLSLLLFICSLCFFSACWYIRFYGNVGTESIIYTLLYKMDGVGIELVMSWVLNGAVPAVAVTAVVITGLFAVLRYFIRRKEKRKQVFVKKISVWTSIILSATIFFSATQMTGLPMWVVNNFRYTDIYEHEYIDPEKTEIMFPEKKRNLIYIYLESMETSYFSQSQDGGQKEGNIPELYDLAQKNINFSNNSHVGGGRDAYGTTWTIAAMLAQTSGIPLRTPVSVRASMTQKFYNDMYSLTDVLKDNGYSQYLIVGSKSSYGGRKQFYNQHGTENICDIETAYTDKIVPNGYWSWWGMEDKYLFEYAKQKITQAAKSDKPFAVSMLTSDTHHIAGYRCSKCKNDYSEQYSNVLRCSSKQVTEFVSWIQKQDFYQNTTIVISGDHKTMDNGYIYRNVDKKYIRRIYNCFVNSAVKAEKEKGREFTTLDMFPTTLAAMGCKIDGDRLGLGVNLFSKEKTLSERFGFDKLNDELAKSSKYYNTKFD